MKAGVVASLLAFAAMIATGSCFAVETVPDVCQKSSDCSTPGPCKAPICDKEVCGAEPVAAGALCEGGVCDGKGECVACAVDGVHNGHETGTDCGGAGCPACELGGGCNGPSDCKSRSCSKAGICVQATCSNDMRDGDETDSDCGGPSCKRCKVGQGCLTDTDCPLPGWKGICRDGVCCTVSCEGRCQRCAQGSGACVFVPEGEAPATRCAGEGDTCDGKGHCAGCVDSTKNGPETDIDCGGGICPGCSAGDKCKEYTDCASGNCESGSCGAPACSDGMKDGWETDVDCGGQCGPTCVLGQACKIKGDCQSGNCKEMECAPQ